MTAIRRRLATALLACCAIADAWALDAQVSPGAVSVNLSIDAVIDLSSPAAAGADESTPVLRLLGRGGSSLREGLSPSTISLSWDPVYESVFSNSYVSNSSGGSLSRSGSPLGAAGVPLSANCNHLILACSRAAEGLVLPAPVRETIVRELLDGVTVGAVLRGAVPRRSVSLEYRRDWTHDGTDPNDHSATVQINVSSRARLEVAGATRVLEITGRAATPPVAAASAARLPLSIDWLARIRAVGTPSPLTLRSDAVEVRTPAGGLLQRVSAPLSRNLPAAAGGGLARRAAVLAERFSERVLLPAGIAERARAAGFRALVIRRAFSDGSGTTVAEFTVPIGSSSLAGFQLTRVDLRFVDGSRTRVVQQGDELAVEADINYLGSGQLRGSWEWAPASTGAAPLFRPLPPGKRASAAAASGQFESRVTATLVREFLNNRQRVVLVSPALPVDAVGGVLVRLRLTDPEVDFELPVLRYFVAPADGDGVPAAGLRRLNLRAPADLAEPGPTLVFAWDRHAGAAWYRYECHDNPELSGDPVTGAVVPGERLEAAASPLVREALTGAEIFWCRVVAIDEGGRVVAASDSTRVRAPRGGD